jgi:NADPH2:quinone reductase
MTTAIPRTMQIIDTVGFGAPDVLKVVERPVPTVAAGEVLIKVAAAGLNQADLLQRKGKYPPPKGAPTHPGMEVSGVVVECAPDVSEFTVGDRVCALVQGGGYAQYCAAPAAACLSVPANLDLTQAGALPEACFTVWSNVFMFAGLTVGESFMVQGGSSGIGSTAIQIARALGHRVFATAGSDDKCRFCESLGAERAINYHEQDFVAELKQATQGAGVNVILDMVGGDYLGRNVDLLAIEGRLVIIATIGGISGPLDLRQVMAKRVKITGSMLRSRPVEFKRQVRDQIRQHVWPLIEQGKVRPIIDRAFPWTAAAEAHAYMEGGKHKGKVVLEVEQGYR